MAQAGVKLATDKIDFSRVGGVEQDKYDAFNGTRLAKDDARNS